jgi:hypothetical protein
MCGQERGLNVGHDKPKAIPVLAENIPAELKDKGHWVGWRYQQKQEEWTKVPVCCTTGSPGKVNDPQTWCEFETAFACHQKKDLSGIGFVLTLDEGLCGIDLDHCRDPETGMVKLWAWTIIRLMASYTEVTPSGTGIRIFVRGTLPGDRRKKGDVEMYDKNKYLTTTGAHLSGTPRAIENRHVELNELYEHIFMLETGSPPDAEVYSYNGVSDAEIISKAKQANNGDKFTQLWGGDWSGYDSQSEADIALCRLFIFWVGGRDAARVEQLFGQSKLSKRDKWSKREDYRARTIDRALKDQKEYYSLNDVFTRVTRPTQSIQANSAFNTRRPTGGGPMDGLPPVSLDQAMSMAIELADGQRGVPDWRAAFDLARRLRRLTTETPEQFESAVAQFCQLTDRPFEGFWLEFLVVWERVRSAEGDDVFAWAANMAEKEPYTPSPCFGLIYQRVASIAWHLSQYRGGRPFWLPRPRLSSLLNTYPVHISRVVELLERRGVIKCTDQNYRFTTGPDGSAKAKEYEFTGPPRVNNERAA